MLSKFFEDIEIVDSSDPVVKMINDYHSYKISGSLQSAQKQRMQILERSIITRYKMSGEEKKKEIMQRLQEANDGPMGSKPMRPLIDKLLAKEIRPIEIDDQSTNSAHPQIAAKDHQGQGNTYGNP